MLLKHDIRKAPTGAAIEAENIIHEAVLQTAASEDLLQKENMEAPRQQETEAMQRQRGDEEGIQFGESRPSQGAQQKKNLEKVHLQHMMALLICRSRWPKGWKPRPSSP